MTPEIAIVLSGMLSGLLCAIFTLFVGSFLLEVQQVTPEIAIVVSGLFSGLLCGAYGFIQGIKHGQQIAEDK